jgi:hypothetical protein
MRALLVATTVILFYLHYTTPLLLCGELAWYGARVISSKTDSHRRVKYAPRTLAIDLALAVAACLPAISHLAQVFERRANWAQFVPVPTGRELLTLFEMAPWAVAAALVGWAIAYLVPKVLGLRSHTAHDDTAEHRTSNIEHPTSSGVGVKGRCSTFSWPALLACCWYLMPLIVAALLTHLGVARVCYPRYLMASSVALPVIAACGVAASRRVHLGLAAFVSLLTVSALIVRPTGLSASSFSTQSLAEHVLVDHASEDWRGATAVVRQRGDQGRHAVFLAAGLIEDAQLETEGRHRNGPVYSEQGEGVELAVTPAGAPEQAALRQYLLFPISGPYSLDDGRTRVPLAMHGDRWLTPQGVREAQASGGGWFIFRSPEAIYPDHPKPTERLARDLAEEFAQAGVRIRIARRQSFRGLAVIHVVVR